MLCTGNLQRFRTTAGVAIDAKSLSPLLRFFISYLGAGHRVFGSGQNLQIGGSDICRLRGRVSCVATFPATPNGRYEGVGTNCF